MDQPLLLFDGVCNLCNRSVQWVIRHDRARRFRFAPLQGEAARKALEPFGGVAAATGAEPVPATGGRLGSVTLLYGGAVYTRSTAILQTLRLIGGPWSLLYAFKVIPKGLRDRIYDWVARNRYRWFGKRDTCMIPTPALKSLFLD